MEGWRGGGVEGWRGRVVEIETWDALVDPSRSNVKQPQPEGGCHDLPPGCSTLLYTRYDLLYNVIYGIH